MAPPVYIIGDIHLANHKRFGGSHVGTKLYNARAERILTALDTAQNATMRHAEPCVLVLLGDVFDSDRPEPQLIAALQERLGENPNFTIVLPGNHDMTTELPHDNAVGCLHSPQVQVVHAPVIDTANKLVLLPYRRDVLPALRELVTLELLGSPWTLCGHFGIRDEHTPEYQQRALDAVGIDVLEELLAPTPIRYVYSGHWHKPRSWSIGERRIVQLGAFCPAGFQDQGATYGLIARVDTPVHTLSVTRVPSFHTVRSIQELHELPQSADTYVRMIVPAEFAASAVAALRAVGTTFGGWEVMPDAKEIQQQVRKAASAAARADCLEDAVSRYVKAMQMPEGVDANDVFKDVMDYILGVR